MTGKAPALRIDWHRVLDDIAYLGVTGAALAERTGVRVGLLQRVATGRAQPNDWAANRLACLWCDLLCKPVEFLPRTADALGATRSEIPNIESDEEPEQSYAQLQSIVTVWAQITSRTRE